VLWSRQLPVVYYCQRQLHRPLSQFNRQNLKLTMQKNLFYDRDPERMPYFLVEMTTTDSKESPGWRLATGYHVKQLCSAAELRCGCPLWP